MKTIHCEKKWRINQLSMLVLNKYLNDMDTQKKLSMKKSKLCL